MYKRTRKKVKTKLGKKTIYTGKHGRHYVMVKGKYYPLNPKKGEK